MTITRASAFAVMAALGVLLTMAGDARQADPGVLLRAAIEKEDVAGDLEGAMALYRQIIAADGKNRAVTAKALLRLGGCHEKLGQQEARKVYERLVAEYSDQSQEATSARNRLAALKTAPGESSLLPALRLAFRLTGATAGASAAVSPDGRLMAYVSWDTGDLAVRDLRSGQSHMVTNKGGNWETDDFAFSPRWSPDGKRLAYYWYRDKGELNELRITDLSGENTRVLYSSPYAERRGVNPAGWFPDGTALLATQLWEGRATEIVRVSAEGGAISSVWRPGSIGSSRVCLSPDGKYIAFDEPTNPDSLNMDVFVIPASGGRAVPIVTGPYDDRLLDWTPDGRRILVASNRSGAYDLWLMQVDRGKPVGSPSLLHKELGMVTPIGFSPDGSYYFGPDVGVRDVVLVDWDLKSQKAASAAVPATEHFSGATRLPSWSPDGRKLAYLVDRGFLRPAETRVRVRDMETGAERTLADVSGTVYSLSWSPDGTSVAMTASRAHSPSVCQILEVTSGKVIREFASPRSGEGVYNFMWDPEGNVVYYVAAGANQGMVLRRRDLRTGDETLLYSGAVGVPIYVALSPDGQHLALNHGGRIMMIAASGGEPRELVPRAPWETPAWSHDGRYVYFGRRVAGTIRLHRVAVAGGAPEDLNFEVGAGLRFRPDGRQLAFTRSKGERGSEIWVMENVLPALAR